MISAGDMNPVCPRYEHVNLTPSSRECPAEDPPGFRRKEIVNASCPEKDLDAMRIEGGGSMAEGELCLAYRKTRAGGGVPELVPHILFRSSSIYSRDHLMEEVFLSSFAFTREDGEREALSAELAALEAELEFLKAEKSNSILHSGLFWGLAGAASLGSLFGGGMEATQLAFLWTVGLLDKDAFYRGRKRLATKELMDEFGLCARDGGGFGERKIAAGALWIAGSLFAGAALIVADMKLKAASRERELEEIQGTKKTPAAGSKISAVPTPNAQLDDLDHMSKDDLYAKMGELRRARDKVAAASGRDSKALGAARLKQFVLSRGGLDPDAVMRMEKKDLDAAAAMIRAKAADDGDAILRLVGEVFKAAASLLATFGIFTFLSHEAAARLGITRALRRRDGGLHRRAHVDAARDISRGVANGSLVRCEGKAALSRAEFLAELVRRRPDIAAELTPGEVEAEAAAASRMIAEAKSRRHLPAIASGRVREAEVWFFEAGMALADGRAEAAMDAAEFSLDAAGDALILAHNSAVDAALARREDLKEIGRLTLTAATASGLTAATGWLAASGLAAATGWLMDSPLILTWLPRPFLPAAARLAPAAGAAAAVEMGRAGDSRQKQTKRRGLGTHDKFVDNCSYDN